MIEAHIQIPLTDGRGAGRPGRQAGGARRGSGLAGNAGLTSRAAVTPRPVFLRPPSVTGAGHGNRIGLRALILPHATFRCVGRRPCLYEHPV